MIKNQLKTTPSTIQTIVFLKSLLSLFFALILALTICSTAANTDALERQSATEAPAGFDLSNELVTPAQFDADKAVFEKTRADNRWPWACLQCAIVCRVSSKPGHWRHKPGHRSQSWTFRWQRVHRTSRRLAHPFTGHKSSFAGECA